MKYADARLGCGGGDQEIHRLDAVRDSCGRSQLSLSIERSLCRIDGQRSMRKGVQPLGKQLESFLVAGAVAHLQQGWRACPQPAFPQSLRELFPVCPPKPVIQCSGPDGIVEQ